VLVVSEVCVGGYGVGRVGEGSERGEERVMGWSGSCAVAGMAEENPL